MVKYLHRVRTYEGSFPPVMIRPTAGEITEADTISLNHEIMQRVLPMRNMGAN